MLVTEEIPSQLLSVADSQIEIHYNGTCRHCGIVKVNQYFVHLDIPVQCIRMHFVVKSSV